MAQQDTGVFSVRRPRETLANISHNASAIPMPSSAMKRSSSQQAQASNHMRSTSGSRMSLAPGRPSQPMFHRSSSGENLAAMPFSTVQRTSTQNFFPSTGGRKSFAPVASTPATALQFQDSTARRSSVYSARPPSGVGPTGGNQSFFQTAPPMNSIPTDPRRLKNSNTMATMGQELLEYLAQHNFEQEMRYTLRPKTMTDPIQKEFDLMFQFLYRCIDPAYRFQKSVAVEIPPLLKQLRYPFERNISKSQLAAVGGNNWHTFLGLLHWMMQLARMMEQYSEGMWDDACVEAGFDVGADRITFQFLSDAYKEWLSMEEDDDDDEECQRRLQPHVDTMAAKFDQSNAANLEQVKALEAEAKALQDRIDELSKSAPVLAKLDETIKVLEEDRVKFETYNDSMEVKVEKYTRRLELLQQEIEKCDIELAEAEADRDGLQRRVDAEGLSVQDIDRMNTERERLIRGVETTQVRLEETRDRASKKEDETGAKLDELEASVQRYNTIGYSMDIIPASAQNAQGYEYELRLEVRSGPDFSASQLGTSSQALAASDRLLVDDYHGYQPQHLLPHADLKTTKRRLQDLRRDISERRSVALEEDMAKVDMLDKTREALEDKHSELETLKHRVSAADEEFNKMKEISTAQGMASDAQIEKMEKELKKMRGQFGESVQLMEQREMSVNLEYEELTIRCASLREELHSEIERVLNEVIRFKIHIQGSLEAYEEFVESEDHRESEEKATEDRGGPSISHADDAAQDDSVEADDIEE